MSNPLSYSLIHGAVERFDRAVRVDPILASFYDGVPAIATLRSMAGFVAGLPCVVASGHGMDSWRMVYPRLEFALAPGAAGLERRHRERLLEHLDAALGREDLEPQVIREILEGAEAAKCGNQVELRDRLDELRDAVVISEQAIVEHPLYEKLHDMAAMRTFMEYHVFAVWDFMCLLKSLQRSLTCVDATWRPVGQPATRRLINEIVLAEESDEEPDGTIASHFELYLRAMAEAGADTGPIRAFLGYVQEGHLIHVSLQRAMAPVGAAAFVYHTMDVVNLGEPHLVAAAFTVGREQAIPKMFLALCQELNRSFGPKSPVDTLCYYLERHVQVDGDEHSVQAARMLSNLCGNVDSRWTEATEIAISSLRARRALWSSIAAAIG